LVGAALTTRVITARRQITSVGSGDAIVSPPRTRARCWCRCDARWNRRALGLWP